MSRGTPSNPPTGTKVLQSTSGVLSWQTLASGVTDHAALTSLAWTSSGHTGTPSRVAAFDGGGAASYLQVGVDLQAYDSELAALASTVSAADTLPYYTGAGAASTTPLTSAGRQLIDDASFLAMRTTLGLAIGTDVQAWDANLDQVAALAVTDGNFIVGDGAAWVAESGNTARTSLGLGSGDSPTFADVNIGTDGGVLWSAGTRVFESGLDLFVDADTNLYLRPDNDLYVAIGATSWVLFDGSQQYVHIGAVTAPSERLHVASGNIRLDNSQWLYWAGTSTGIQGGTTSSTWKAATSCNITPGTDFTVTTSATGDIYLNCDDLNVRTTGLTTYLHCDGGSQNIGIGNSTTVPTYRLEVTDSTGNRVVQVTNNASDATNPDGIYIDFPNVATADAGENYMAFSDSGGFVGSIDGNGTGVNYNTSSDVRLKQDIIDAPSQLDVIRSVRVREFAFRRFPDRRLLGVIAQELDEVYPDAVTRPGTRNDRVLVEMERRKARGGVERWEREGRRLMTAAELERANSDPGRRVVLARPVEQGDREWTPWKVDHSKLVVPLIRAVQELAEQNERLAARVAALERAR